MNHARTRIRGSRIVIIGLMLVMPLVGPGALGIVLAVTAAMTAYEGLHYHTVYALLATLFGIELVYGFDVGILSLSYVAAVCVLVVVGRVMTIESWMSASGWHASDALRVLTIACGLFAVMAACTVIVGHFLYGYTDVLARLQIMFLWRIVAWTPIVIIALLIVLRRIDEPFRRSITFGT